MEALGLCESTAGRYIAAARVCRHYPEVFDLVASGALHASALSLLRKHLTTPNAEELSPGTLLPPPSLPLAANGARLRQRARRARQARGSDLSRAVAGVGVRRQEFGRVQVVFAQALEESRQARGIDLGA